MEPIPRPEFCAVCREPLPQGTRGRPRTTCGDACRKRKQRNPNYSDAHYDKRRKAWQIIKGWERRFGSLNVTYPEWAGLTLRDRLLIRLQRDWPITFCYQCQRPYMRDAPDSKGNYCSSRCMGKVRDLANKANGKHSTDVLVAMHERLGLPIKRCKHCGIKFAPKNALHHYHSSACRSAAYRHRWRKCRGCGTRFERTKSNRVFCTSSCAGNQRRRNRRQMLFDSLPTQYCIWCGDPIPPRTLNSRPRKYCKAKCRQRYKDYRNGSTTRLPRKSPLRANLQRPALPPLYRH